tara:strand:- start:60 stop:410 length:351 start_codon:yes stop_codon:yes gene_type:complete
MTIGKEIKEFRKANNLNQKEFAEMIGISSVSVSRWESGKDTPSKQNRKRIKDVIYNKVGSSPQEEEQIIRKVEEVVIITFESGHMIAVDKDQALNEIVAYFDSIEDIQLVEYISPS